MTDARRNGQFWRCSICGHEFMFERTMTAHFNAELQDFRDLGRILQEEYAESRKRWRAHYFDQFPYVLKGR